MTESVSPASPAPTRRRVPILGIIAFAVAFIALAPSLAILLFGFLPGMSTIWWLMLWTFPFTIIVGFIALVLSVVALILDIRARRLLVWSIIALALSVINVLVPLWIVTGGFSAHSEYVIN